MKQYMKAGIIQYVESFWNFCDMALNFFYVIYILFSLVSSIIKDSETLDYMEKTI